MEDRDETPIEQALNGDAPNNLLDQLAKKREAVSEAKEIDIPLPGYDNAPPILLARYRLLEGPDLTRIASNAQTEFRNRWERNLYSAVDVFVAAVIGLYYDMGDGVLHPLTVGGVPVTGFTRELAEGLQFADKIDDPDSPRSVIFGLFANNDVMIGQHSFVLQRWFTNTTRSINEDMFAGNL